MPTIFDNIDHPLLPDLQDKIDNAYRADFCVGYFNLRGWRMIADKIEQFEGGDGANCRLLVGMIRHPREEVRQAFGIGGDQPQRITQSAAGELRKQLAREFREQLTIGAPTNWDEAALQQLKRQLQSGKLVVKLYLKHPLHAKMYLLHYKGVQPEIGYLGSSNLTFSGLSGQGELNIDVRDTTATRQLTEWFEDRWDERLCVDITQELIDIIEESWARETPIPPYYIYLKMAYHLSREAQKGIDEFAIPEPFDSMLFDYQKAAVQIAARYLNQQGGVLIGDVVGLGKTLMATTLMKVFQEDQFLETLIICPKNLESMWQYHADEYRLHAKVLPISQVLTQLPEMRRYRLVLIDESHNLRNRDGKRYRAIREYIQKNDSRCILLSATPYNKSYLDMANQLRLFIDPEQDLGVRPERLIRELGMVEFNRKYESTPSRSLLAFEKSEYADDWRELMRLFMVRRTRSFIRDNYATEDTATGRKYLTFSDGGRSYFPERHPRRIDFEIDETDPDDQYARLYREDVVDAITNLNLPRYGLGLYVKERPSKPPTASESLILENLSRGGKRLMGFSRTNLFKRLESSGYAFQLSVERHILRNHVFIYALKNGLNIPVGTQDAVMLDTRFEDGDVEAADFEPEPLEADDDGGTIASVEKSIDPFDPQQYQQRAAEVYNLYATQYKRRFKWIRPDLFDIKKLRKQLQDDADDLLSILMVCGRWNPEQDAQLDALEKLLTETYADQKVLVFSQFADTVHYLETELQRRGVQGTVVGVTGQSADPTYAAWRFSPNSNDKRHAIAPENEIRVLVATDVLSEGQNLQDAYVVVNYDLPWAIIRLIQRAGRVDRIGQKAEDIYCYSFWPAEGIERIIRLRQRLRNRLQENAEVVGTDEQFFEDEADREALRHLYNERSGILDEEGDKEVDLVSQAFEIWNQATAANPTLKREIEKLPSVVYSAKGHEVAPNQPAGVLVYLRTALGNSALAWLDEHGERVSQSQYDILTAASCTLDEPALPREENHHELVQQAQQQILEEQESAGVQLGRTTGARFKTYERLKNYADKIGPLLADLPETLQLKKAVEQIGRYRLRESATDKLNRQLRVGISDEQLGRIVTALYEEDKLCIVHDDTYEEEPQIICSLGLVREKLDG